MFLIQFRRCSHTRFHSLFNTKFPTLSTSRVVLLRAAQSVRCYYNNGGWLSCLSRKCLTKFDNSIDHPRKLSPLHLSKSVSRILITLFLPVK